MPYYRKYTAEFWDNEQKQYRIDIEEDTDVAPIEVLEMELSDTPITLEFPEQDIFSPIKTGGGTLEIIATEDRQYVDLFTSDYQKFKIILYEVTDNEDIIRFVGYIDPELYEQPLRPRTNYKISVLFNDGLASLKRIRYLDDNEDFIEGIDSAYNILKYCLNKIGLFNENSRIIWASDLSLNATSYSNRIPLQFLICNNENYVDEDRIAMTCYEVIESILRPLSLSLMIIEDDIWIVDLEYVANHAANLPYRYISFTDDSGNFSTTSINVQLDLGTDLFLRDNDVSFSIESSFNYYKLIKDRYMHDLLTTDFSSLNDISEAIALDIKDAFRIAPRKVVLTAYDGSNYDDISYFGRSYARFWICTYNDIPDGWVLTDNEMVNKPKFLYYAWQNEQMAKGAFFGGIKQLYMQSGYESMFWSASYYAIPYDEDDKDFVNYLFINNPGIPYDPPHSLSESEIDDWDPFYPPWNPGYHNKYTIFTKPHEEWTEFIVPFSGLQTVASYQYDLPYVSYTEKTLLNLQFHARPVFLSDLGFPETLFYYYETVPTMHALGIYTQSSLYSYFVICLRIYRYDAHGNIMAYLRLAGDDVVDANSQHLDLTKSTPRYEWVPYTGNETLEQMICRVPIANVDVAGNPSQVINTDTEVNVQMPLKKDENHPNAGMFRISVEFTNMWYEVWNIHKTDSGYVGDYAEYLDKYHLRAKGFYKQGCPYLGIKDISLGLIYADTLKEVAKEDQEIQYSVNAGYQTESRDETIYHNTRDDTYVTDVGGFMLSTSIDVTNSQYYIKECSANGVTQNTLEDLKGNKMIRHYQKNRILLSTTIYTNTLIRMISVFTNNTDSKWNNKKWLVREISSYDIANNSMSVLLEEL